MLSIAMRAEGTNFRVLGILWFVYGCTRIAGGVGLALYSNTLALMWGALLNRVADALSWMVFFHAMLAVAIAWCVISALFAFLAGLALMGGATSARRLAIVAALVSLPELPFGVILGAYTLLSWQPLAVAGPQAVRSSYSSSGSPNPITPLRARESR